MSCSQNFRSKSLKKIKQERDVIKIIRIKNGKSQKHPYNSKQEQNRSITEVTSEKYKISLEMNNET